MGRKIAFNLLLRKEGSINEPTFFAAGEELPDWAEKLVGDHVFGDSQTPAPKSGVKTGLPSVPEAQEEEPESMEAPPFDAHVSKWRQYANHLGLNIPAKGIGRDEIQEKVRAAFPEMLPEE